jgi:RNA polymerase subunit RPABC4/transcription elongation factor Spt4
MTNCPVCNNKVDEKAKFCPECGVELSKAPSERAWIVAMQEKIKSARNNNNIFSIILTVGIVIVVVVPYYTHFIRLYNMDSVSWGLTGFGALLIIGSGFGIWWENMNINDQIEELKLGQEEAENKALKDEEEIEEK